MGLLELAFASKEDLSVRRFSVHEALSAPFEVSIIAVSKNDDIDLEAIVGKAASFRIQAGLANLSMPARLWTGICSHIEQIQPEPTGLSTYHLQIVPDLWLLAQREDNRVFQHMSLPDIVLEVLGQWKIKPNVALTKEYLKHEYVVQYGETDFAFVNRLLEQAGITYSFTFDQDKVSEMTLSDVPHARDPRPGPPIPYEDKPNEAAEREFVTKVRLAHRVRPGRFTLRDHDFRRRADYQLVGKAAPAEAPEDFYEQYRYVPGGFLVETGKGGDTPVADDKGVARHDEKEGGELAQRGLLSARRLRERITFETNCLDLSPGVVFAMNHHPRRDLAAGKKLLVTEFSLEGTPGGEWTFGGEAAYTSRPYQPEQRTPKPRIRGVQSAIVTGPRGEEIHTDEFGRVRVQFHWDREGKLDEQSSCWMRVSQPWAGAGFGSVLIPRVGQEVLVGFLEGDPDQPVVVGRVYNNTTRVPYKLPKHKTRSTWKSDSSPNSNGFNEILIEDQKGGEIVYVQAQMDLQKLVKNSETERTGKSRHVLVGENRSEIIGKLDASMVGKRHVVQTVTPPSKEDFKLLAQQEPTLSPLPTTFDMIDERVIFTTGEATVAFDGTDILLEASGDITVKAKGGDVMIEGSHVYVNTKAPPAAPKPDPIEAMKPGTFTVKATDPGTELGARPITHTERDPGKGPQRPSKPDPKPTEKIVCELVSEIVHCDHDKSPRHASKDGVLEVVPKEGKDDKITLLGKFKGGCGNHPQWTISGELSKTVKEPTTTFEAKRWNAHMIGKSIRWLGKEPPKTYMVQAQACAGSSKSYTIKSYPRDKFELSWEPKKWPYVQEYVDKFKKVLEAWFPKFEIELAQGKVAVEAAWCEWPNDHRAFYKYDASVGLDPLLKLSMRFPFGPTAALPAVVKKFGDAYVFVEFFGAVAIAGHWSKETPDEAPKKFAKATGSLGGKLGVHVHLVSKKAIAAEAAGGTSFELSAAPDYAEEEPAFNLELKWMGVKGEITLLFFDKWEKTFPITLVEERVIWNKNSWSLTKHTP